MLILMQLINRAFAIGMGEGEVIQLLADLEANAFDTYIQHQAVDLGFEPFSLNQIKRLKKSLPNWESALEVCKMRGAV